MQPPELTIRLGTQDPLVYREVLGENCYRLPERFEADDAIVDIGGNVGMFAVACLIRGCGPVVLVEPNRENILLAQRNTAAWGGQVSHVQGAVAWGEARWVPICDRGPHTAMHYVGRPTDGRISISVRRYSLDELIGDAGVRLLKLDCEGGEYPGLLNSRRLRLVKEIIVECHPVNYDGRKFTDLVVRTRLEDEGFEITHRVPEPAPGSNVVLWARNKSL